VDVYELLSKSLVANDQVRDRSLQVEIGASSIGGCKRQAWHIIQQTPKTNFGTETLSAILGTAIHAHIAEAIKMADPFGDNFVIEQEVRTNDLKGHVDLYIKSAKKVVDWKTTTLKSLERFPSSQQKIQINLYAYLLKENGYEVERVALCGIPRDGLMTQVKVWENDYDQELAEKGLAWLKDVKDRQTPPDPEKTRFYCQNYCSYYDPTGAIGCQSK
jgi:CRISPR/Cas system-associated exonuclease Cas4 (RecB family)